MLKCNKCLRLKACAVVPINGKIECRAKDCRHVADFKVEEKTLTAKEAMEYIKTELGYNTGYGVARAIGAVTGELIGVNQIIIYTRGGKMKEATAELFRRTFKVNISDVYVHKGRPDLWR